MSPEIQVLIVACADTRRSKSNLILIFRTNATFYGDLLVLMLCGNNPQAAKLRPNFFSRSSRICKAARVRRQRERKNLDVFTQQVVLR